MDNTELKCLVELYRDTKRKLDELRGDYDRSNIETKLFNKLEELLKEKGKESADFDRRRFLRDIYEGIFFKERDEAYSRNEESEKTINKYDIKRMIEYFEIKLEALRQLLGEDNLKRLEKYEEKSILKSVTDRPSESK